MHTIFSRPRRIAALPGLLRILFIAGFVIAHPVASHADVVTDWYATATNVTANNPPGGVFVPRHLALTHLAIHDALNAIDRRYESFAVAVKAPTGASPDAAAAGAAHAVLLALYPSQKPALDAALSASLAKVPEGAGKTDGLAVGKEVGDKLVELRRDDGSARDVSYTPLGTPGTWKPTPPSPSPLVIARWPQVKPLFLRSADQFKAPPPPDAKSERYAREVNEVKRLGGVNSRERTADQTAAAIFWVAQTWHPFLEVARQEAERRKFGVHDNARLYALVHGASLDAYIVGYGVKLIHHQQRPVTAIREAANLGNPRIEADPDWLPLAQTPQHPDYVSGHAIQAASYERILQAVFGSDALSAPASAVWPAGTVRRVYTSWSQLTREDNDARIWGGIHTRSATDGGDQLGWQIGDYIVRNVLKPVAH
ncbi:vanadium-dependent haloperoxidase [Piscinibacter sp. XHJ-5]|uniref:vanadium-dependent haloperoxidase n=1 Tax=Piscinibacter sp. XHJ-5 TaxID=3037797 RepID=UPI002453306C|nr:vanadium-dependent haloperoxidase [Piscinibacter sp. XHJ-5]